jgi:hypothetical protein
MIAENILVEFCWDRCLKNSIITASVANKHKNEECAQRAIP